MAGCRFVNSGHAAAEIPGGPAPRHHIPDLGSQAGRHAESPFNGRALFNLVTGGDPEELAAEGLHLNHTERYEASAEFTHVWRKVLEGETVDFAGKHIQVKGAKLLFPQCSNLAHRCILAAPQRRHRIWQPSRLNCI